MRLGDSGYSEGVRDGYERGYDEGYREGIHDSMGQREWVVNYKRRALSDLLEMLKDEGSISDSNYMKLMEKWHQGDLNTELEWDGYEL